MSLGNCILNSAAACPTHSVLPLLQISVAEVWFLGARDLPLLRDAWTLVMIHSCPEAIEITGLITAVPGDHYPG